MKKIFFLAIIVILLFPMASFAHGGRTDSNGGHRDNSNKSGLGSYHYHCGGHPAHLHENGVCPYDTYIPEEIISDPPEPEYNYDSFQPPQIDDYTDLYKDNTKKSLSDYGFEDIVAIFLLGCLGISLIAFLLHLFFSIIGFKSISNVFGNIAKWSFKAAFFLLVFPLIGIPFIAWILLSLPFEIIGKIISWLKGLKQPKNTPPQKEQKAIPLKVENYSATQKTDTVEILDVEPSEIFFNESLFDTYFEDLDEDIPDYDYKIPAGTIIGNDGLPADIGATRHWGKTYTVYVNMHTHIYHKGSCRYVKPSTCYPEHIIHASKMCTPCKVCKPQMPDLDWYFEAQKLQKKL